jgi:hypothetical protein
MDDEDINGELLVLAERTYSPWNMDTGSGSMEYLEFF